MRITLSLVVLAHVGVASASDAPEGDPVEPLPEATVPGEILPDPEPWALEDVPWSPPEPTVPSLANGSRPPDRALGGAYVYGIAFGAWTGGTVGFALGDRASDGSFTARVTGSGMGAALGAGIGLGTAGLITTLQPDLTPTRNQFAILSATTAMGAFTGFQVARAIIPSSDLDGDRRIALAGTLGGIGGIGGGLLWARHAPPARVSWNFGLGASIGAVAAGGAIAMADPDFRAERAVRAPVTLASAWAVGTTAGLLRAAGVPGPDAGLLGTSLVEGAWLGGWAPLLVTSNPSGRQVTGGMRLGLGAGYLLSQVLAPVGPVDGRSAGLQAVGFAAGNALGAGIPLALGLEFRATDAQTRGIVAPMLAGSVAGMALGAAVAPHYDLSPNDAALIATLGAWTTYQTVGWTLVGGLSSEDASVSAGHGLATAGAGGLIAMGFAPLVDLDPSESLMAASIGGWGTLYGAWIGHLVRLDPEDHWAVVLGSGNGALAVGLGVLASPVHADWADVAFVDGFGFLGGAVGSLVGIIASPETDPVAIGCLTGTTVGLATGAAFAIRRPNRDTSLSALGIPLPKVDLPVDARVAAHPWFDDQGQPGVWVQVDLVERRHTDARN